MNEPKECHFNNNDTLNNCLAIMGANTKPNKHRPSSHGIAAAGVRDHVERRRLADELKETWEE